MKIIHFSDPHAGGPAEDWLAYVDKRWVGVFNYNFRRRFQHDLSLLDKAVEYILDAKPDLAICTGDITSTGQPGEFAKALESIKPLRESDIPMVYVPGNHDHYVKNRRCVQALKEAFSYLNTAFELKLDDLPVIRTMMGCDFLIVNESGPTNLISSAGYMNRQTSDFLLEQCSNGQRGTNPKILIGHYPLNEDHPILRCRHRLFGEKEALRLLNEKRIDLSLCGHVHKPEIRIDDTGRGEIIAGSITRNHCLAQIEYMEDENRFTYEKVTV